MVLRPRFGRPELSERRQKSSETWNTPKGATTSSSYSATQPTSPKLWRHVGRRGTLGGIYNGCNMKGICCHVLVNIGSAIMHIWPGVLPNTVEESAKLDSDQHTAYSCDWHTQEHRALFWPWIMPRRETNLSVSPIFVLCI